MDPVPSLKVKTFNTMSDREKWMLRLKMTTELSLYNADKDLFGRLYIAANTIQSIWKKLCAMSCPQFHAHSHTKIAACEKLITYSILLTTIEKEVNVAEHLT